MSLSLVFEREVREEIDEAYQWFESRRLGLGEEFLAEVQGVLDGIVNAPELHAVIYKNIRHVRVKRFSYAVYDGLEAERLAVIAVHHGKRDPKRWQSRA